MKNFLLLLSFLLSISFIGTAKPTAKSSLFTTISRDEDEEEIDDQRGTYKIELTFKGNIAGFAPALVIEGYLDTTACPREMTNLAHSLAAIKNNPSFYDGLNEFVSDEDTLLNAFLQYKDHPEAFNSTLVFTSHLTKIRT